ncbi:D-isomer specific 2-hydroxyacid dehydrogenase family protein [Variovorax sp. Sphag1AA]|uniref:NAD(P)-dependent oxidoreductase n=1 Tax=Variovorax sp. Sphag1AA TaxID=2587027 RepID=UPI0016112F92|nr:NAD(P)-dependent oxidoreductase [Variovorax sp. Sphag1AA]MBB3178754.1 D-3-phosphoglycerate dehydrogenase [Variovorax sp. Sphag1AA]
MSARVFVTHPCDKLPSYFGQRALDALRAVAEVRLNPQPRDLPTDELIAAASDCDALIAYRQTSGPARLFDALPRLKAFIRCAMDIRTVDVAAASALGVLVTQAGPGFNAAVAEWIVGAMIDLARGTSRYVQAYRRGEQPVPVMGRELRGAALGIVGFGGIGSTLCPLARAFGMPVLVNTLQRIEPREGVRQVELPVLLAGADFVVCLAPANAGTAGLFGAEAFAAMKPGAFFINASRGELVDEAALLQALETGQVAGCALDVGMAPDQMPSPALARHPRVVATPHIGGLTPPAIEHQALETVSQLTALLQGQMPAGAVNAGEAFRLKAAGWKRT